MDGERYVGESRALRQFLRELRPLITVTSAVTRCSAIASIGRSAPGICRRCARRARRSITSPRTSNAG